MKIVIEGGESKTIDPQFDLSDLGEVTRERVGNIVPRCTALRFAFRVLRRVFGETGRVAAWTRTWKCQWVVDLRRIGGAHELGPFDVRSDAIEYERKWVEFWLTGLDEFDD